MSIYLHKVKSRWQPGENTVSYFPLQSDGLDVMGNYTLSNIGTQKTLGRNFTGQTVLNTTPTGINTTLVWMKLNTLGSANYVQVMRLMCWNLCFYVQGNASNPCFWMYVNPNTYEGGNKVITAGQRHLIGITREKSGTTTTLKGYVDGVEYQIFSGTAPQDTADSQGLIFTNQTIDIDMSDFIMESKTWAKEEIEDYYMLTKGDYYTETPWEMNQNTIVYMPMDGDAENKVDGTLGTWSGAETYYTLPSGIDVAHSNSSHYLLTPTVANSTPLTVSCWIYRNSGDPIVRADSSSGTRSFPQIGIGNNVGGVRFHYSGTGYGGDTTIGSGWHNIIGVFGANGIVGYIDGRKICESSFNSYLWRTQQRGIGYDQFMRNVPGDGYYSNLIIESKERSADEVLSYYHQTRNDYVDDPWYPTKEYSVENIYIGHLEGYQPNENTVIYFPLTDDIQDHSGKSVTVSTTGSPTITTYNGVKCCYFNGSSTIDTSATNNDFNVTWSAWVYQTSSGSMFLGNQPCGITQGTALCIDSSQFTYAVYNGSAGYSSTVSGAYTSGRHHFLVSNKKIYIDGEYKTTFGYSFSIGGNQPINLGGHNANSSCTRSKITGYMGETFIESGEWTAEQVAKYYNSTKNNYTTSSSSGVIDPGTAIK